MKELLYNIVCGLVEDKTAVEITVDEPNEENTVVYHVHVAQPDMGRVIGKQGRIAKAIRIVAEQRQAEKTKRLQLKSIKRQVGEGSDLPSLILICDKAFSRNEE